MAHVIVWLCSAVLLTTLFNSAEPWWAVALGYLLCFLQSKAHEVVDRI